jgi:DnaK suppressor protein
MNASLTPGQRAQLRELLELRQHELDRRIAAHLGTQGRTGHARVLLEQDGDDAPQRDAEREVDLAQVDRELDQLGAVSRALARLHQPAYGLCVDCSASIPFDRLKAEPWATRCVDCEGAREGALLSPKL